MRYPVVFANERIHLPEQRENRRTKDDSKQKTEGCKGRYLEGHAKQVTREMREGFIDIKKKTTTIFSHWRKLT